MGISSNQQILIVIIIGIVVIFFLYNRSEDFVTSTEAVNNISSLYNTGNLTATNISATGNINATGAINAREINANGINVSQPGGKNYFKTYDLGGAPFVNIGASLWTTSITSGDISAANISATDPQSGKNYFQTYNLGSNPITQMNAQIFANDINARTVNVNSFSQVIPGYNGFGNNDNSGLLQHVAESFTGRNNAYNWRSQPDGYSQKFMQGNNLITAVKTSTGISIFYQTPSAFSAF